MATIPLLKHGRVVAEALIDDADFAALWQFDWQQDRHGYARRYVSVDGKRTSLYMHRELMGNPDGIVDHINRNRLDNRRVNLRVVSHAANSQNVSLSKRNRSGYRGVWFNRKSGKWMAQVGKEYLGCFETAEEAGAAAVAMRFRMGYAS